MELEVLKLTKTGEEALVDYMGEGVFSFTQGGETVVLHVEDLRDMVVVNTGSRAYRRADGVAVIPAALLGP